ncbi:ephrin type-B receptor 3-like [Dendronephthya gigantea]|uniref:ephrin type-B receptor 3-like n=1 Tax=Dendronephthya gigantea TaxID=151771 RepID=UPI001069623A|nr:ephrin type-B receptor 3-like [Dendronephthya gigantea]
MYSLVLFPTWIIWITIHLPFSSGKKEIISNNILEKGNLQFFLVSGRGDVWGFPTNGDNYVKTCGLGSSADFWFVTKYMNLPSSYADVIYVDVEAMLTADKCFNPPDGSDFVPCFTSDFEVYTYRESTPEPERNTVVSLFNSHVYTFGNNSRPGITQSFSFSFSRNGTTGVSFGVRSRGACGKIFNMTIYHYFCEEKFSNSIRLVKTSAPLSGSKLVPANCSQHSLPLNASTGLQGNCKSNGTWDMNEDFKCLCIEGYEPNTTLGCSECPTDSFKPNVANTPCKKCPLRSRSINNRTSCQCKSGFYKSPSNYTQLSPCYAPLVLNKAPTIKYNKTVNILTVSWIEPSKTESLDEAIFYDVKCVLCNEICNETCKNVVFNPRSYNLSDTLVAVTGLQPDKKYIFRVFPKNSLNEQISRDKWNFKETNDFIFSSNKDQPVPEKEGSNNTVSIIVAVIAVVLLVIIIFIVVFAFKRRGNSKPKDKHLETFLNNGVDLPNVGLKPYVDPSNYSNAEEAVEEFANELDLNQIFLERMIGGGEFGDVYKGVLTSDGNQIPIAVKTLKADASSKNSRDFLLEASVMAQFDNPNVVKMEGVVTKSKPRMIVIEYMSNGSLDHYLKRNDGMLTQLQLLGMARGVASGMNYLSEIHFVHRDLAARNVLVNDMMLCKISDFGLSRELETTNTQSVGEYETSGGKIPIRWTAPEAFKFRIFSTASDVWSFGILLWEIMSFGQRPYWEWDNFKVMEDVDNGYRLPPPHNCPHGIHCLMLHCWKAERSERPSFAQITIVIDRWIRSPETLNHEVNFFITIGDWLTTIKMGSYKAMFIEAGYKKQSDIIDLTHEDLISMGVTLIGHRNKIIKGIETLRARKSRQQLPLL